MALDEMLGSDLDSLRSHDPGAFGQVSEKYRSVVFATAYRILGDHSAAEDITQETFLRAFGARQGFRGESEVGWWLTRVASNLALNRSIRNREVPHDIPDQAHPHDLQFEVELSAQTGALRAAVAKLPETLRVPLILFEYQDYSCAEIAARLDLTEGAVRVRLLRARRDLAKSLTAWSDTPARI